MPEIDDPILIEGRDEWIAAGAPVPLVIWRSGVVPVVTTWEVCWHDSLWNGNSGCATPIAEFTSWDEAIAWAQAAALEHGGICRIGRDRIVGPMPPTFDECVELGLTPYGPPWVPVRTSPISETGDAS